MVRKVPTIEENLSVSMVSLDTINENIISSNKSQAVSLPTPRMANRTNAQFPWTIEDVVGDRVDRSIKDRQVFIYGRLLAT